MSKLLVRIDLVRLNDTNRSFNVFLCSVKILALLVATVCSVLAAPHDPVEPAHHDEEVPDLAEHAGFHNVQMLDLTRPGQVDPFFGRVSV